MNKLEHLACLLFHVVVWISCALLLLDQLMNNYLSDVETCLILVLANFSIDVDQLACCMNILKPCIYIIFVLNGFKPFLGERYQLN